MKQKGCNGLSYTLDYTNEKGKFDEEVTQDGKIVYFCLHPVNSMAGFLELYKFWLEFCQCAYTLKRVGSTTRTIAS